MGQHSNRYYVIHQRLQRQFPKVGRCEYCAATDRRTEYASVGHRYSRWRHDWFELCQRCHHAFDGGGGAPDYQRAKTHCPHGHEFTPENTYIRASDGGRECHTCRKARAAARYAVRRRRE
jgi:hypothetical protein